MVVFTLFVAMKSSCIELIIVPNIGILLPNNLLRKNFNCTDEEVILKLSRQARYIKEHIDMLANCCRNNKMGKSRLELERTLFK